MLGAAVAGFATALALAGCATQAAPPGPSAPTGSPRWATAGGTGAYLGLVSVVFYDGKILWVTTGSPKLSTVEGAAVGMALSEVKALYGPKAAKLSDSIGDKAIGVPQDGGSGLFFRSGKDGTTVSGIEAGDYETLTFRFTEGEGC